MGSTGTVFCLTSLLSLGNRNVHRLLDACRFLHQVLDLPQHVIHTTPALRLPRAAAVLLFAARLALCPLSLASPARRFVPNLDSLACCFLSQVRKKEDQQDAPSDADCVQLFGCTGCFAFQKLASLPTLSSFQHGQRVKEA